MGELENNQQKEEIFSKAVRAGKRTYFFDVRATKSNEYYLTITESKKRFDHDQGKFYYEKHKIFLYKEDFDKFTNNLTDVIEFIRTGKRPPEEDLTNEKTSEFSDVDFEDLDDNNEEKEKEKEK